MTPAPRASERFTEHQPVGADDPVQTATDRQGTGSGLTVVDVETGMDGILLTAATDVALLAVDRLLDMTRTAVNVFGDSCAALVVAKSEGEKVLEG